MKKPALEMKRPVSTGSDKDVRALKGTKTKRRLLATSPRAKRIVQREKGLLLSSYRLIRDNFKALEKGRPLNTQGIFIQKAATGKFKGTKKKLTLLVKSGRLEFFVKVFEISAEVDTIRGFSLLEEQLKKRNYNVGGFRMHVLKPLLLYEHHASGKAFLVSSFLRESEVEQVSHMKDRKKKKQITNALDKFGGEMEAMHDILEIASVNAFYHKKTGTVLLFDIYHFTP